MESYDDLIARARARVQVELAPLRSDFGGEQVQLSVRLPAGLRAAVADVARRRNQSLTGFIIETLERAVREESDPFAGLAGDLVRQTRAVLAEAVEGGAYAEAAAEVDEHERDSATG